MKTEVSGHRLRKEDHRSATAFLRLGRPPDGMTRSIVLLMLLAGILILSPATSRAMSNRPATENSSSDVPSLAPCRRSRAPVCGYRVLNVYPHDPGAFTQGLVFHEGFIYESTGRHGASTLRKTDLDTGKVLRMRSLPSRYFAEGLTLWQGKLLQITWTSGIGFICEKDNLEPLGEFSYPNEGWGITHDGRYLIMSDGTTALRFLDPHTFAEVKRITVRDGETPVTNLNELEYIKGEVFANVWRTDCIARISPETGQVLGWIDLSGLLGRAEASRQCDVLNGIAYDASRDRIFVTGKLWPRLFEIELVPMNRTGTAAPCHPAGPIP